MSTRRGAQGARLTSLAASKGAAAKGTAKTARSGATKPAKDRVPLIASPEYKIFRQIVWDLVAINNNLEDMRRRWAKKFGVTGPQWMIMMAINDLDQGRGVSVGEVSAKIQAVSTFVTTQTKLLEQRGLLKRVTSTDDARVVLMSLSDRAWSEISSYFSRWGEFHDFIFGDLDAAALHQLQHQMEDLKKRTDTVCRRVSEES
ncbi:MarR family winged helix-turn-helix transcriptional regulator [Bradyrhizobium sp. 2TAF24]|uniref:MarR family winged helix-turn-helix transcriptional regulator n=1 Tax=Bradyrhizobium sp. 2TAF24 TaxID=3233011 RepID=UPI003F900E1E